MNNKMIEELVAAIGRSEVLYDDADLVSYSFDATPDVPSEKPVAVVTPLSTEDVVKIVKIADKYDAPIYVRGAGTNLSGGTIPTEKGIVMLMVKMNKILEFDAENLAATVEPGLIVQTLNDEAAKHGLIYPPDPGTVKTATMAGTMAENAGGLRGLKYGVTKHYIMGVEVVLADGSVVNFGGKTVKNVTAYDFVSFFTGSEGTLGIITKIVAKLVPAPEAVKSMVASFKTLEDAGNVVSQIIAGKVIPATLEILDNTVIQVVDAYTNAGLPLDAAAILLIEVDGIPEVVEQEAKIVADVVKRNNGDLKIAKDAAEKDKLWAARRSALPALAQLSPTTVLEDATVPRSEITNMLKELERIAKTYDLKIGTFGHAGDGNLHPTIICDERDKEQMSRVHKAVDEIFAAALKLGGTLSGEHGIGIAKMAYLESEIGPSGMALMKTVKEALDPKYLFNRGKMVKRGE